RHTRCLSDWSSDVCSSDLDAPMSWNNDLLRWLNVVSSSSICKCNNSGNSITFGDVGKESHAVQGKIVNSTSGRVPFQISSPRSEIGRASCTESGDGPELVA